MNLLYTKHYAFGIKSCNKYRVIILIKKNEPLCVISLTFNYVLFIPIIHQLKLMKKVKFNKFDFTCNVCNVCSNFFTSVVATNHIRLGTTTNQS